MEDILVILYSLPFWVYIVDALALGLAVFLGTVLIISRVRLSVLLDRISSGDTGVQDIRKDYSVRQLAWHAGLIERKAEASGINLPALLGLDDFWVHELERRRSRILVRRVLAWAPEKGLFLCFLDALENEIQSKAFLTWMEGHKRPLRLLAQSSGGSTFPGEEAWSVFSCYSKELRLLSGDTDPSVRLFAVQLLIHDPDPRSRIVVLKAFQDPDWRIRELAAREIPARVRDSEELKEALFSLYLNDVSPAVRKAARARIDHEYEISIDCASLSRFQSLHLLELLDPEAEKDRDFALYFLEFGDPEQRRVAASYLERVGILRELFLSSVAREEKGFARTLLLLSHACDAGVNSFLLTLSRTRNMSRLYLGLIILKNGMRPELLARAARRVFFRYPLWRRRVMEDKIYCAAFDALRTSPDARCRSILSREIKKRKWDVRYLVPALRRLEGNPAGEFLPLFLLFLKDPDFTLREELFRVLRTYPIELMLPELLSIMRGRFPVKVQRDAMRLLSLSREPFCVQQLLERLPGLDLAVSREIFSTLYGLFPDIMRAQTEYLFASCDARLKARLLLCLPGVPVPELRLFAFRGLADDDKEVRLQSLKTLKEYGDVEAVSACRQLITDPVPEVRMLAAKNLAEYAEEGETIRGLLADAGREAAFKKAILDGLSVSSSLLTLELILWSIAQLPELQGSAIEALSLRKGPVDTEYILRAYGNAEVKTRALIAKSYARMDDKGASSLSAFLSSENQGIRSSASEILDYSGYAAELRGQLFAFSAEMRLGAVKKLAFFSSFSAFQGLVMAASDPDRRVREESARALRGIPGRFFRDYRKKILDCPDKKLSSLAKRVFFDLDMLS